MSDAKAADASADAARAEEWLKAHEEEHTAGSNADLNQCALQP